MAGRPSKPMTEKRLGNMIQYYLERYDQPAAHVRRHFLRKITQSAREHQTDTAALTEALDANLARLVSGGTINDARVAENLIRSGRQRGWAERRIKLASASKGIPRDVIDGLMKTSEDAGTDRAAALLMARRRRIGPWRTGVDSPELRRKELAILARGGFSYGVARDVVGAGLDDLDDSEL